MSVTGMSMWVMSPCAMVAPWVDVGVVGWVFDPFDVG